MFNDNSTNISRR